MNDILRRAAALYGVTVADLCGPRRTALLAEARFLVAYALRQRWPDLPLAAIGAALGGRDHSTALHALRRAEALRQSDARFLTRLRILLGAVAPTTARQVQPCRLRGLSSPPPRATGGGQAADGGCDGR